MPADGESRDPTRLNTRFNQPLHVHSGATALLEEQPDPDLKDPSFREEWQLALRIASSKRLSKSDLLPKFLLFICEQSLSGKSGEITEQRIGTQIFNRPSDYNPGEDNIVRSYARLLRKRLTEYFDAEGRDEPMRIVIPRGGYIPLFERHETLDRPSPIDPEPAASVDSSISDIAAAESVSKDPPRPARLPLLFAFLAGTILASAAWLGLHALQLQRARLPAHPLWAQLFDREHKTLIVPADSGLGILQNLSGSLVSLEAYANGTYPLGSRPLPGVAPENVNDLRGQRYTSLVDLEITSMLTQLPEYAASHPQIRYARSITTEDLKDTNVILLGSSHTNPWVSLFDKTLNFKLRYMPEVNRSFVLNERPQGHEPKEYQNGTNETPNLTYGVVDYLPSLDGSGHVLIIQGLNMAATQAAADTLFDPQAIQPVLKAAALPGGSLRPFELLVETSSVGATAPGARILAVRLH